MKENHLSLDTLKQKKSIFEAFLKEFLETVEAPEQLRQANEYALTTSGKRIRPIITLLFGEATRSLKHAALALELFHTASLVADDLPCMDNDDTRRDKPSLHVAFNETTALLTTYGMICAAFKQVGAAGMAFEGDSIKERLAIALDCTAELAGFNGATGGQHLDIYPTGDTKEHIEEVFYKKTVTLFEVAFVLGWIFSGRPIKNIDLVRRAAYDFGLAFQIADDIADEGSEEKVNVVHLLGKEAALAWFDELLSGYTTAVESLGLTNKGFEELRDLMLFRARPPQPVA